MSGFAGVGDGLTVLTTAKEIGAIYRMMKLTS